MSNSSSSFSPQPSSFPHDVLVIGTGGVGSAALFHLARRGARVLGLDRFPAAHDRGSSHGQTRMIRQAYFEHPDYVPLVRRAYALWTELEQLCGEKLYHEVGLLQVGPSDGRVVRGVLASAGQHGLQIETLAPAEVESRWQGFSLPRDADTVGLFERKAGYLRVEACVRAHLDEAVRAGATLRTDMVVRSWRSAGGGVEVETDQGRLTADRLVIAAGAWSGEVLRDLGIPLEVRRKPQYWYETTNPALTAEQGCPAYLFETPEGIFYGFPQIDALGVKIAEHSGGRPVLDPSALDREIDPVDQGRVEAFAASRLRGVTRRLTRHSPCMYTMTPDEHFVIDRHPAHSQVVFAAGLSGHGFKFAPVLGEALADLVLTGRTDLPIGFLSAARPGLHRTSKA